MTLKLTPTEAQALRNLFEAQVMPLKPIGYTNILMVLMVIKVYRKLRNQLEGLPRRGYSIKLNPEEAAGYIAFFRTWRFDDWPYETNVIDSHIILLDQNKHKFLNP